MAVFVMGLASLGSTANAKEQKAQLVRIEEVIVKPSRVEFILNLMAWRFRLICFAFLADDLVVFDVILLFQDIRGWELQKMMQDPWQDQKRISYISIDYFPK
jgi:hypothetical protein